MLATCKYFAKFANISHVKKNMFFEGAPFLASFGPFHTKIGPFHVFLRPFHDYSTPIPRPTFFCDFFNHPNSFVMMGSLVTCSRTLGLHRSSYIIRPGRGPVVKPDFGPLLLLRVEAVQKEAVDGQGSLPQGEQRKQNRNIWNIG